MLKQAWKQDNVFYLIGLRMDQGTIYDAGVFRYIYLNTSEDRKEQSSQWYIYPWLFCPRTCR